MLFLSGVIGSDPKTGELVSDDVAEQTKACMERLKIVLEQAGMDFSDVVRGTVFLVDINDYTAMNKVYGSYFKKDPPARACVQTAKLVRDAKVEISMIAIKTE
jgi:2-iminobutanoate/2-iminopropanoate deaminase